MQAIKSMGELKEIRDSVKISCLRKKEYKEW